MSMVRPKNKATEIANEILSRLGRPLPKAPDVEKGNEEFKAQEEFKKKSRKMGY